MKSNSFEPLDRYVVGDFSTRPPFTSFLPGIAGPLGIPMWIFYANRGQGITSFGVESKDHPLMEFQPANKAYRNTSTTGFRTFLKLQPGEPTAAYEPFSPWNSPVVQRQMLIGMNELELQEQNQALGLQTNILYFTIPGESYAGLARVVTLTNTGSQPHQLEILDGLPILIPAGVNNFMLKEFSRTIEAWMAVFNLEQGVPFYRVRASIEDKPEVEMFDAGHFALAFTEQAGQATLLKPFVDPATVFGQNTALVRPDAFHQHTLAALGRQVQITTGKTPCAFFGAERTIQPGEAVTIYSLYGYINDLNALNQQFPNWLSAAYFEAKRSQARQLVQELTAVIATQTSQPLFDGYCRQTFLDNLLRGGWPVLLGQTQKPYYIYSRKHGDPERDYNAFSLAAEYYSQGNGNYRDVNQNRRSDVFFEPQIGAANIYQFMSLIQADGYNPLVVRGSQFVLPRPAWVEFLALAAPAWPLEKVFAQPFTPGKLLKTIMEHQVKLQIALPEFLGRLIDQAEQHFEADFGEGYWTDHWTYNLDLIESYLAIYPDQKASLLWAENTLTFYDSPAFVNPRQVKYVLTPQGPRQLNAIWEAPDKEKLLAERSTQPHQMRSGHGSGDIYYTDLFSKLVLLALVKFTTLDPAGMGIEMEAGKPGWYDAMNGLPALFGSSVPEAYELKRLLQFLLQAIAESQPREIRLPVEVYALLVKTGQLLEQYNHSDAAQRDHDYWDAVTSAREAYRQQIRLGLAGQEQPVALQDLKHSLNAFLAKVEAGLHRAETLNGGMPPTYLTYQVEKYEPVPPPKHIDKDTDQLSHFKAKAFAPTVLPLFLEGPVRALKTAPQQVAADLFRRVRASDLYDRALKMYKVNASLADQPHDIGRARAFTPGWLENESIWLHMEYKYLLEILKAGLYEQFFEDFRQVLIPFLDPERYQRSPLENSSFLVSSAHPDPSIHGAGFVARLSGSTAEFLSIWRIMMAGKQPFFVQAGELCLKLAPILPGWLFTGSGKISFKFLGQCSVHYHNPDRRATYQEGFEPERVELIYKNGETVRLPGALIPAPHAQAVRVGQVAEITVHYPQG
ncbi:MAG: hypothetical protein JW862_19765 [Anaerolineales bacterium]|nr:hypothetical protein [Anaerolineales bacterium]